MIQRSSWRDGAIIAIIVIILLAAIIALVIGAVQIVRFVWAHVAHTHIPWNWSLLQDTYSTVDESQQRHPAADKIAAVGAIFTALFTLMLWRVTGSMGRASHRQAAGDSPLLRVDISIDPLPDTTMFPSGRTIPLAEKPALGRSKGTPYPPKLRALDKQLFAMKNPNNSAPQRFVRVRVHNVQSKPFAVARDIVVTATMDIPELRRPVQLGKMDAEVPAEERSGRVLFPAETMNSELEGVLTRRLELELLSPDSFKKRPLFDIGPFHEHEVQVSIIDVEYRDLRGRRRRRAAYGQLTVKLQPDGTVKGTDGYSRPERWEMP